MGLTNKEIVKILKTASSLMELHGANAFKVRAYSSAVMHLERLEQAVEGKSKEELLALEFSKSIAEKIAQIDQTGSFTELEELLEKTPEGVVEMLEIKGIGAKKIATLWKELGVETISDLLKACQEGKVAQLKGFAEKTQKLIIDQITFREGNQGKLHFSDAEQLAKKLADYLSGQVEGEVSMTGQLRRNLEIIDTVELIVGTDDFEKVRNALNEQPELEYYEKKSGPFVWRGEIKDVSMPLEVLLSSPQDFAKNLFIHSSSPEHLAAPVEAYGTLRQAAAQLHPSSEQELYEKLSMDFVPPEMREGTFELKWAREKKIPRLVEMEDLKGILHNHSTYSDGQHTLEEMAAYCKELGYEYLGISDHSQSAFYANGLSPERVEEQHKEIDALNHKLAPFKIFKGIESDILNDGSLDYEEEVLAKFDFIVASVHSNLKMDEKKATERLLKAIRNPYTTILGHPTGRLLLKREGYPIDHKAVIDACAEHKVSIEINANPWRLDLDWRWVRYALDQNIMISINPDAHEKKGYHHMRYGLLVGRKAGLTKDMTLNALSVEEIEIFFSKKGKKV
ncbi:DNA polymerase/3'-5' exonuclease PolX [Rapidithrix thailandica]|uniref:DNA polymerase/3'-5' exonuclease PolX n=1 Tax=Rapidithrix thailandica TaxID=413964 RepID=A0AAW9S6J6_9BACT